MKQVTTVAQHKSQGKIYFRTAVPSDIAINLLGLVKDQNKQKLTWKIENGKVVVQKYKN